MKKQVSLPLIIKCTIYLILIGQLWVSTVNYCYWMIDYETELVELNTSEENESEEESEKKEKENKNRNYSFSLHSVICNFKLNSFCINYFISLHLPEVTTPPPEFFIS